MATNYPSSTDNGTTLPNPNSSNFLNSPDHASLHGNANDAIKAIEAKVGTGASTPVANRLLYGDGTGTSSWTQLTSAQLAASLTNETGTGLAVFNDTPTLLTPKMDTINEATATNGVTIDGLNIKDNKLNTNDSVVTNNITDGAVTGSKLSTSAIKLGFASTTTNFVTASTSAVQYTGLTSTVTIPAGGRSVKLTGYCGYAALSTAGYVTMSLWDGVVGGTKVGEATGYVSLGGADCPLIPMAVVTPAAGSKTYNLSAHVSTGTGTFTSAVGSPAFILVELI